MGKYITGISIVRLRNRLLASCADNPKSKKQSWEPLLGRTVSQTRTPHNNKYVLKEYIEDATTAAATKMGSKPEEKRRLVTPDAAAGRRT